MKTTTPVQPESAHTPTPWAFDLEEITDEGSYHEAMIAVSDQEVGRAFGMSRKECEANAAFICRAVNHHQKLVDALINARLDFERIAVGLASKELADEAERAISNLLKGLQS